MLYRLNALFQNDDGFRGYDQNTQRTFISPSLTWKLSDRTDFTVSLESLNNKQPLDTGLVAVGTGVVKVPLDRITNEPDDESEQRFLGIGYTVEHPLTTTGKLTMPFAMPSSASFPISIFPLPLMNPRETCREYSQLVI